jgi:hypothetical protein
MVRNFLFDELFDYNFIFSQIEYKSLFLDAKSLSINFVGWIIGVQSILVNCEWVSNFGLKKKICALSLNLVFLNVFYNRTYAIYKTKI